MHSFSLHTPTRIFFGADQRDSAVAAIRPLGQHAFVVIGGGTVERLGYLEKVSVALAGAGMQVTVFSGIEPNPEAATINRATAELRAVGADVVVALGGGSVMDAAKAIAGLAHSGQNDIWPFVLGETQAFGLKGALPIVAIPTTAATASEVTPYAVISNRSVKAKSVLGYPFFKPKVAWLNPEFTTGLGLRTTQDGAADILSHVFENYLLGGSDSPLADRHAEGVIATVLETLPPLLADPTNVDLRGRLLWASTLALNEYPNAGRVDSQFVLHSMEHALSGFYPDLAHGRGLATLYPPYFRWLHREGRATERLAQLASRLFGVAGSMAEQAEAFIEKFEAWLDAVGLKQSLPDLGIDPADYPAIAAYTVRLYGDGTQLEARGPLDEATIISLFTATKA